MMSNFFIPLNFLYYIFISVTKILHGELMKYVIVYWSRYGNGKRVIDHLAKKLKENKIETQIVKTDEADPTSMPEADLYIFSAPTEAFNVQKNMKNFMRNLENMAQKKYGIINTHGMKKNRLSKMEKLLSKKNMVKVADLDLQVGENVNTGNGLMKGWENKVNDFAEKL